MATDYNAILKYMPFAKGAYGTGRGTPALSVGWNEPVEVKRFQASSPDFQAALYKNSQTGKYHIAIAGTDDLNGDAMADMVLAGQDAHVVGWHPEMSDALSFAHEAFKQIAGDLRSEGKAVTLDAIRERVDVSGHSLGGALAEMVGKFFGLSGYNIDGPGVTQLIGRPEYAAFQHQVRSDFPELESDYKLDPGQFGSTAFSIVGATGKHLDGVEFSAQPGVMTEYAAVMGTLAVGTLSGQAPIVGISVLLAANSAANHPSGAITGAVEQALGYPPVSGSPTDFGTMSDAPALAFYRDNPKSAAALAGALGWYSQAQGLNVEQGLSPNGIPLDGSPVTKGPFRIVAQQDPDTGRIREIYVPVSETGAAIGSPFVKEYVVDTAGDVGLLDVAGNLTFIQSDSSGHIGVLTVRPDGRVDFQGITSQQQGSGVLDVETARQIIEGKASANFGLPPIDFTNATIDALLGALPNGPLLASNGGILSDAGSQYGQPPNVAAQQAAIRNLLSPYGDRIQFARAGDIYTLYNADGELIGSACVDGAELRFQMLDGSEHRVNAWGHIDGGHEAPYTNDDVPATTDPAQIEGHDPGPQAVIGAVQSLQSLMQAIESGDTKAIALASAAMLSSLDSVSGGQLLPNGVTGGLNALAAGMNLLNAIQDGDGLGIAASSLNLGSQAAAMYANVLKEQGIVAFQAESGSAASLLDTAATVGQVAGALAFVASVVTLVKAIEDGNGVQTAGAALSAIAAGMAVAGYTSYCPPVAFAAIAVTMIGSAVFAEDLPTLEGEATAVWNPDGSIHVLKTTDAEDGGATPANILQSLVDALQVSLAQQVDANGNPLYAIIPQRLPTIGYIFDPDGARLNDNGGQLYLKWIDDNGQEQRRYYDGAGLRYDTSQATIAQQFMQQAFAAIVPAWEAESVLAHMRESGVVTAPATGSIEENRSRAGQQLHSPDWHEAKADAGMPEADADGIHQHFTALTVDLKPELPAGVNPGRIGKNVDLDGYIEQTDWVKANQGILSIDVNGDGRIGQNEILTNDPDASAAHARNSVQWLDVNHDGKLDASDPAFAALGIWLDVNRNGQTDQGEFASFLDRGIASLDFTSTPPVLRAADGSVMTVTEHHLTADVRGDAYQAAFVDTDGDGQLDAFAGMLHAKEGGETILNAVVTHDYTGEAGHTHGGVALENASAEMQVAEGDSRIKTASDKQHEQTLAEDAIVAGDDRVADGEGTTPVGQTTATRVQQDDSRLTSKDEPNPVRPAQRTDTVRPADGRVASAPPASPTDAFAAIRDQWIKSSDSLFAGTGALLGVAAGAVAGVANAAEGGGQPDAPAPAIDTTGNNTISHLPAELATTADSPGQPQPTVAQPPFVQVPVNALPPATRRVGSEATIGSPVEVTLDLIGSVPADGVNYDAASDDTILTTTPDRVAAGPNGEDIQIIAPDVADEQVAGIEDTRYAIDAAVLLANDTSRNVLTQPLRLINVYGGENGTVTLTLLPDGSQRIVFTPDPDYWGPARFRYTVEDEYGLQATGRVYLDIAPVNDAPVTAGETAAFDEDTGLLFTSAQLLANDFDVDTPTIGDVLSILRVSDATHGLVALDAHGNVRFLPDLDYFGPASFVYWVSDGNGGLTPATVNLEIRPVNDVPVVAGETVATDEDTVLLIEQATLLANDWDVDSPHSDLTVFSVRNGQHGTVELTPEGQIRFVPEQDFFGTATFFYTVYDGAGGYTEAMATVDLAPVNDAPIVTGEDFRGNEDEVAAFTAASLLANDRDVDDAQATLTLVAVGNALHGEVRLNADGTITFIPEADYFGAASFEYTVSDPHGAITTGRVDIDLAPVNDAPRLRDDVIASNEDTALTIDAAALLANDADVDNPPEALSITRVNGATHGTVSLNPDGTIRFVPDANFFGDARFTYEVSDGVGGVSTATATIHVAPVNDAPIANDNIVDGRRGVAITLTAAALLADDFDIDNPHGDLHIVGVSGAEHGTVRLNADGSVTFLPEPGFGGYPGAQGHFTYTISDGVGGFATATTTINLEKINTTPVAVDDGFSGYENTPFVINTAQFLANDADPDGDALSVTQVANAQHGTVEIQADGQVRFTPDHGFYGQASFQYLVSDPYGGQTWATAFLHVEHVNKAPIIEAIEYGRAIFGYFDGPPVVVGQAGPGAGAGSAGQYVYSDGPVFQPVYDEALALSLALQGQLFDAGRQPYTPSHYQNGMLRPLALDQMDGDYFFAGASYESERVLVPANDPRREMGRIIAYDPDDDTAAIVISIVQAPQHGYAYANTYRETEHGFEHSGELVSRYANWQYESHAGDPYTGADAFTIRITDAQGASMDVVINATHKGTNASGGYTPLVMDLNGNGVELLAADQSNVKADVNHDGQAEQIGWAAATDGVLGFDADGDGKITVEETRLTNFAPDTQTDLEALATFDTNGDGRISKEDAAWSQFKVVQDVNGNGEFSEAEHKTLDDAGIASIALQRQGEAHLDHGNVVFGTVDVTHTDGSKSEAADVMFAGKDVPLPSFALYVDEVHQEIAPTKAIDDAAFAADAVAQLLATTETPSSGCPYPPHSAEAVQWSCLQWNKLLTTADGSQAPGGFVPPREDTLADMMDRAAQASAVGLGMGQLS